MKISPTTTTISSVAVAGAVTRKQMEKIEVAELKVLSWALGVTKLDKIRNEYLRGTAKARQG